MPAISPREVLPGSPAGGGGATGRADGSSDGGRPSADPAGGAGAGLRLHPSPARRTAPMEEIFPTVYLNDMGRAFFWIIVDE